LHERELLDLGPTERVLHVLSGLVEDVARDEARYLNLAEPEDLRGHGAD
jgi:hypothetical protein